MTPTAQGDGFLNIVSSELQTLQSVIEEANMRILKLQSEINANSRQKSPRVCGHNYSLSKRPPQSNPDEDPEEAPAPPAAAFGRKGTLSSQALSLSLSAQETRNARNHARVTRALTDDPDLQGKELVHEQFIRIDTSKNGHLSAQEVTAIALTHGAQVTVASSFKAIQYVSSKVGEEQVPRTSQQTRLARGWSARIEEAPQGELTMNGFMYLRSDPTLVDEAPAELCATLLALRKALEDESDQHMFETNKAKFNQRQRQAYLTEGMDVGIVAIIAVNAIVIGIGADHPEHVTTWEVLEVVFFLIYLAECLVKNWWWGVRTYFCGADRSWNLFDFACLLVSAVELLVKLIASEDGQSQLNLLKVLRLARLFRLVRIMRFKMFKELKLMAMGLLSGIRALAWAIVLLMVVIYTISIITKSFFGDTHDEFKTVGAGMFTLFRCFTEACETYDGDPIPEKLYVEAKLERNEVVFQFGYVLVTMLVTVGLFNLIMAVFIDNVTKSQNQRKQKELGESALDVEVSLKLLLARFINEPGTDKPAAHVMERFSDDVVSKLTNLTDTGRKRHQLEQRVCADEAFKLLKECNINITREIFQAWLRDPEFVKVLEEADVDISNKFELFNILDVDLGGELSVHELLTGLMSLRGEVSKGDVVYILLRVRDMMDRMEILQQSLEDTMKTPEAPERVFGMRRSHLV